MNDIRWLAARGAVLVFLVAGCGQPPLPPGPADPPDAPEVEVDGVTYRIGEPLTHKNMTVIVLTSDRQDERDFLTLDEGLKGGLVKVTEQEQERVGALQVENQSDRPLYLQEGERLRGGKQDRIIASSLVVPPRSGQLTVPTFCVEQSRWREGEQGKEFGFVVNPALAPKGVRASSKVEGDQGKVWKCVGGHKASASDQLNCPNTNSSVNETLDAAQVREVSEDYAAALAGSLDGPAGRDGVGVVIVVNGQIEEINVYPNAALFRRLCPRLIQSYALQARLLADQPAAGEPVSAEAVAQLLKSRSEKSKNERSLDAHNTVRVSELDGNAFLCRTEYDGQPIHWQVMKKNGGGNAGRCARLGSDW
jgi:hypothetical protein